MKFCGMLKKAMFFLNCFESWESGFNQNYFPNATILKFKIEYHVF